MKKVLSIILVVVMLCSTFAGLQITSAAADLPSSGSCGRNVTYTFDSATGLLTISGSGDMYDYFYMLDDVSSSPFDKYKNAIKTITINSGVTRIGEYAFFDCSDLTSVSIPDSVTSIGDEAFELCSSLTSITISASVTSIGSYTFYGCGGLTSIIVDENNTVYDSRNKCNAIIKTDTNTLLRGCQNTVIPDSVRGIGDSAFSGCSGLTSVTLPASVTSIGNRAFYDCSGLISVSIPDSVTSIASDAFSACSGLASIIVASNNSVYDSRNGCEAIIETNTNTLIAGCKNTVIPNSVTSIGEYAFYDCSSLTGITIPDSVRSIGRNAFEGCTNLQKVNINSIEAWCKILFYSYAANPLYYAHNLYLNGELITDLVIPNSVTGIGNYAFYGCSNLTRISIPDSVTRIGGSAFSGCSGLTSVTIPDFVTSIDSHAFSGCSSLTSVTIPDSVTSIGLDAFSGPNNLKDIYYAGSEAQWRQISKEGDSSYDSPPDWYENENVTIHYNAVQTGSCGENVTYRFNTITGELVISGSGAMKNYFSMCTPFYENSGIKTLVIESGVTSIGNNAFEYCNGLTYITIPNSVTSIGEYAFDYCSALTSITIPDSVTSIGNGAFLGCRGLESITVSADNTVYDSRDNCNAMIETSTNTLIQGCQNTVIPNSVTSIVSSAFSGCSGLTGIIIPNSVTSIGDYAFADCYRLPSVTIPDSVTSIGEWAFLECSALTSITIPDSVTNIGKNAFYNCNGLTSVTIGKSVTSIGDWAFDGCTHLQDVYFTGTQEQWNQITIGTQNDDLTNATIHYNYVHEHTYTEAVTKEPTCLEAGIKTFTCTLCGESHTESIPALEHSLIEVISIEPSCQGDGLKNIVCEHCKKIIEMDVVIPALGHAYESAVTKQPTCSAAGEKTLTCSRCGKITTEEIAKTSHNYQAKTVEATCITKGFTVYTCMGCSDTFRAEYTPAVDTHEYKAVVTKPATCSQTGIKTYTCTVCGDKYNETIPMVEHAIVADEAVAPTCTKYGLTEGKYCSACGKVFELQEKLEPLGHDYGAIVTPATLTKNGVITHPCSRCDKSAASEVIYAPKTFTLAKTSYVYSGKAIAPAVTVKDAKGNVLKKGTDYTVAYKANKAIGTASAVITFKGNYKGTKTLAFTIVPKATNLALAGAKKAFTAKWTKVAGVTGYQVQYATNAKLTGAKTVNVKGAAKYVQAFKNLKGGAKYYVRIRTYKTVGGKNYFSAWSAVKAVTTKK